MQNFGHPFGWEPGAQFISETESMSLGEIDTAPGHSSGELLTSPSFQKIADEWGRAGRCCQGK